ncbi:MAG: hypothetical protein WB630_15110 [Candidatus Acidiferrales bacterium]
MEIKRVGSEPSGKGPSEWFTGTVPVDPTSATYLLSETGFNTAGFLHLPIVWPCSIRQLFALPTLREIASSESQQQEPDNNQ